jgi:hypothetical protein
VATVLTRSIASTPERTAAETWDVIVDILAPDRGSDARAELMKIAGVAAASIASEAPKDDAFVVYGNGPQIRIYCVFGDDAVSGEGINENALIEAPTSGDWRMSMPCPPEDLEWTQNKLKQSSTRISARAIGENVEYEKASSSKNSSAVILNLNEFLKS